MEKCKINLDTPRWKSKPTELGKNDSKTPCFSWDSSKEDSLENRTLYMKYLEQYVTFPPHSEIFDGATMNELLIADVTEELGVKLKGSIDIVLASDRHQHVKLACKHMWAGIELKKDASNKKDEIQRQVILQHLAASFLNRNKGILTILTDLCKTWNFYWFSKNKNSLMIYEASTDEAKYLICNMKARDKSTPKDFLNRASWNDMFEKKLSSISELKLEGGEGEDDVDEESDGLDKQQGPSNRDRLRHRDNKQGGTGSGGGDVDDSSSTNGNNPDSMMDNNLDFMDEEEEQEAKFREVLSCILPQLGWHVPKREKMEQGNHSLLEGPPKHIFLPN